jgi:GDPmannose 4,6-dehydratase
MIKKALITGITGQDGSYLAELLLDKGYEVHGIIRRSSSINTSRIDHIFDQLTLHYGDITDSLSLDNIISKIKPDEIYNLSAQSHVQVSFEIPEYTGQVDALGTLKLLEAVRKNCPNCKVYQASTSELFGKVQAIPQVETTPFYPRSPYGVAKMYSFWICKNYRESYNMFISNGILFNHESPRRGVTFVTKKITIALSKIHNSLKNEIEFQTLKLGNMYSKRDWGYAKDYVEGMYRMLQSDAPDDFILATNETHSIKEFITEAVKYTNIDLYWVGEGADEKGYDRISGKMIIEIDKKYFRPAEVDLLIGDYTKAKTILGWEPTTKFSELVQKMMEFDLKNTL